MQNRLAELGELMKVSGGEPGQKTRTGGRKAHTHAASIFQVTLAPDQTGAFAPVDQTDGALVADLEALGEIGYRGAVGWEPPDEQEELILSGCDARLASGVLREAQESPESEAEA